MESKVLLGALGFLALPLIGGAAMVVSRGAANMTTATNALSADIKPPQPKATPLDAVKVPTDSRQHSWRTVLKPDDILPHRRVFATMLMNFDDIAGPEHRTASPRDQQIFASLQVGRDIELRRCP